MDPAITTMKKISASVAILTLNNEKTLERCLRSVADFAEIVICDGNSTDGTLRIAKKYHAKIIPQFSSNKKNQKITNKANIRNKALDASSFDWHVYLDSDDELSPEVITEIKKITTAKKPTYLIYKMPLRHVIDNKIIKYSSNYPLYQNRLFNKKSGARFIKPVHERIDFDKTKNKLGMLKGFYNIHWDRERASNFWQNTVIPYWKMEINQVKNAIGWKWYVRWILGFQVPITIGLIVRVALQYAQHGFTKSMPIHIELGRIGGKLLLITKISVLLVRKTVAGRI
jgi:glycosyltransferase involved in cell wall biosynthesis